MLRELRRAPWWAKGILGLVAAFVVLVIVGSAMGSDDEPSKPQATRPTETAQPADPSAAATADAERTAVIGTAIAGPSPAPQPTRGPDYDLALISSTCTTQADIGYSTCEGFVRNVSGQSLENITAVITWVDANGVSQTSDDALIDYNPVLDGQESPWSVISNYNPALTQYRVSFKELLGGTILTRDDR